MRSGWVVVACLPACYNHIDLTPAQGDAVAGDAKRSDARADAAGDGGPLCFGHSPSEGGWLEVCPTTAPAPFSMANAKTIFTNDARACEILKPEGASGYVCVIVATTVDINAQLTGHGAIPLVIAATGKITISADVTVSSHVRDSMYGAGGGRDCGSQNGGSAFVGGGGGPGGSYQSSGGSGGATGTPGGGAMATGAGATSSPTALLGGCNGAVGGLGNGAVATQNPALGGGAIALLSLTDIQVAGLIEANGAAGVAGASTHGGAGGASGGMIVLDAPMIELDSGSLAAIGGGGGQGGDATNGQDGSDPIGTAPGSGGTAGANGGPGGDGAATSPAGDGGSTTCSGCGGGGGGGGTGFILVKGQHSGTPNAAPPVFYTP